MNENIFDKRRLRTFSNCKELVKSMIGTRDGLIAYNEKFRLDLENTCYKASICEDLEQENKQLKEEYNKEKYLVDKLTRQLTDEYKNTETQSKLKDDYKQRINKAIELIENVYNSLENVERPIIFYEKILEILKGSNKGD